MKNPCQRDPQPAFTLIELLLVISIIAVLAALLLPVAGVVEKKGKINAAQAELSQVETAINSYKSDIGYYPPDNPRDSLVNPLYYELEGTTNDGVTYVTLDGSSQIAASALPGVFHVTGFVNSSTTAHGSDNQRAATTYLKNLRADQIGQYVTTNGIPITANLLVCSVQWPNTGPTAPIPNTTLNPWRYISTNPTNNPGRYDLWVDLLIGGQTNRISNWSKQPQIVP